MCLVVGLAACSEPRTSITDRQPGASSPVASLQDLPYAVNAPDAAFELPDELEEISGLTVLSDGHLGAVQDEDGLLFQIDGQTGDVLNAEPFGDSGDYEGVEATPDALWVLKSNGTVYELQRAGETGIEAESFNTELNSRNDAEGLGYDAEGNRLLIALKGHPGNDLDGVRAMYAFDLASRTLSDTPVLLLDRDVVDTNGENFKPSALAVRPGTQEIYILSSVKKSLLVVLPDGTIQSAVALSPELHRQPEGIAFAPDGTLFISNEGAGRAATLLRFSPR
ncbi:MAG: SdiA-regulated domain-containing protein [Bacteroidota bacterium]